MKPYLIITFLILFISFSQVANCQPNTKQAGNYIYLPTTTCKPSEVPVSMSLKGNTVECLQWNDSLGQNILILTETGRIEGQSDTENAHAALCAYHYFINKERTELVWKVYDFIDDCPVDIICEFYKNAVTITDLDNDGVAEITLLYALACKGDISPDTKKLIMYAGKNKFVIRGTVTVIAEKQKMGGEKVIDKSFLSAPHIFLEFATHRWDMFGVTKY